jgi:phosphotransferase system IIB component
MADETAAIVAGIIAAMGGNANNTASTSTSADRIKLTFNAAAELLKQTVADVQYTGKFSKEDIQAFADAFNAESAKNIEQVVKQARSQVTPGASADDIQKTVQSVMSTSMPSFLNVKDFAKDFVWSKVNFKDEATLAGKSLGALQDVRNLAKSFHLLGFSDAEAQIEAKNVAMGKKTLDNLKAELAKKAEIEYPTLADRFKTGITTKDIADPVIKLLAKTWEVPEDTIDLDNPLVQSYIRPGGADGKQPPLTYAEIKQKAMNDPKFETTTTANELARQSATGLARALGAGI